MKVQFYVTAYTVYYDINQPLAWNFFPYLYMINHNLFPLISGRHEDLRSSGFPITISCTSMSGFECEKRI